MKSFKQFIAEMHHDKEAKETAARTNAVVEKRYNELKKNEKINTSSRKQTLVQN